MEEATEKQEPPFAVQVELVEGCNLRCTFCGINGIRNGNRGHLEYMDMITAESVADGLNEAGWNPRIEFAMHGEPSLHPNMLAILRMFRSRLPAAHLMMTSNGGGFLGRAEAVISAMRYLNCLALDDYVGVTIVDRLLKELDGRLRVWYYPEVSTANPHRRRKPDEHDFVVVQDISIAHTGTHSLLNNHAGCGAPPSDAMMGQRCAKPFRELSVRWNGTVAICCNDWRGMYAIGDVTKQPFETIWQSHAMRAARRKLYHGLRDFGPCRGCDARSYRTGLLPDKYGRSTLPEPTVEDEAMIAHVLSQPPLTKPVYRLWETTKKPSRPEP